MGKDKITTRVNPLSRRFNIFGEMPTPFSSRMPESIEDFFNQFMSFGYDRLSSPSVNVKETEKSHEIQIAAPGYKKENFLIDVDDNVLTISNEIKEEKSESKENFSRKEFKRSSFSKSFYLPEGLNADKITANYKDGILYVNVPKVEKKKNVKKIEIQ